MLPEHAPALAASGVPNHPSVLGVVVAILLLVITGAAGYVLLRTPAGFRSHGSPWWRQVAIGAAGGAIVGGVVLLLTAQGSIPHTNAPVWAIQTAVMIAFIGLGLLVANLGRTPTLRKIAAIGSAVVLVLVAAVTVNIDRVNGPEATASTASTASPTVSTPPPSKPTPSVSALPPASSPSVAPLPSVIGAGTTVATSLYRTWQPPAGMPAQGRLETEVIPGTDSHFAARPAEVYLPPAALVAHAPALPVVILLSGQPADPMSVVLRGHAVATLDALAARNRGLAPILVIPDQLGQPQNNPMCVDGPLGNVASYIMTDVTGWIRTHLHVLPARNAWAIGGFSEGGTCSIQFASAHPNVFGSFIDVSGERYPTLASDSLAIRKGFSGSFALYSRAKPENIMRVHGPYPDTLAIFAVGAKDTRYGPITTLMSGVAASHGIDVTRFVSAGTGHDWTTASNGFASGLGLLYQRFGLAATGQYVSPYAPDA